MSSDSFLPRNRLQSLSVDSKKTLPRKLIRSFTYSRLLYVELKAGGSGSNLLTAGQNQCQGVKTRVKNQSKTRVRSLPLLFGDTLDPGFDRPLKDLTLILLLSAQHKVRGSG